MSVFGILAVHDVKETGLDFFSDGAAAAGANFNAVKFANGCDFSGGACEESFVANVNFIARDALLNNL
jgi:hypothetical protein